MGVQGMNMHVTPSISLADAIKMVKAAGYTVTKQRAKKVKLATVGPTFVANWSDGVQTRMSIHTNDEKPDLRRAIRVSHAAYDSRTKGWGFASIVSDHFERGGKVLHRFDDRSKLVEA